MINYPKVDFDDRDYEQNLFVKLLFVKLLKDLFWYRSLTVGSVTDAWSLINVYGRKEKWLYIIAYSNTNKLDAVLVEAINDFCSGQLKRLEEKNNGNSNLYPRKK